MLTRGAGVPDRDFGFWPFRLGAGARVQAGALRQESGGWWGAMVRGAREQGQGRCLAAHQRLAQG